MPKASSSTSSSSSSSSCTSFPVDFTLLHPTFESYRLVQPQDSETEPLIQSYHPLPSQLSLSQISNPSGSILGHKDAKDRSRFSHLIPRLQSDQDGEDTTGLAMAAYVDLQGFLILIVVDETSKPSFHPLCHLEPTPLPTSTSPLSPPPPPSILSLPGNLWLVTLGDGHLSLVQSRSVPNALKPGSNSKRWTGDLLKRWKVVDENSDSDSDERIAFRLLDSKTFKVEGKEKSFKVLIQSSRRITTGSSRPQPGLGGSASNSTTSDKEKSKSSRIVFDVSLLQIDVSESETSSESVEVLRPSWTVTGDEPSFYAKISTKASSNSRKSEASKHLLCSEAGFVAKRRKVETSTSPSTSTNSKATSQPVSSAHPQSDTQSQTTKSQATSSRAQPFSWHQTSDTVTVVFALPPMIRKEQIRSHFQNQTLSLSISPEARSQISASTSSLNDSNRFQEIGDDGIIEGFGNENHHLEVLEKLISGQYKSRNLWGEIDVEGSLWTLERPENSTLKLKEIPSLLTLHLEKRHHGTRWSNVFNRKRKTNQGMKAVAVENEEREEEEEDDSNVPETMDPLELLNAVEGLDKYTASSEEELGENGMQNMADQMNANGFGTEQSSLLRDGLEEEDAEIGKAIVVSWIEEVGNDEIEISRPKSDGFKKEMVLASSLATGSESKTTSQGLPLVIKNGLDGLVFHPSFDSEQESWTHSDTLPALSFVLASKKDAHRVCIHSSTLRQSQDLNKEVGPSTILAFESPALTSSSSSSSSNGGAGNLFVYYSPPFVSNSAGKKRSNYASSRVIRLGVDEESGKGSGALVGAAALKVNGKEILLCLCERSLLVLSNLL